MVECDSNLILNFGTSLFTNSLEAYHARQLPENKNALTTSCLVSIVIPIDSNCRPTINRICDNQEISIRRLSIVIWYVGHYCMNVMKDNWQRKTTWYSFLSVMGFSLTHQCTNVLALEMWCTLGLSRRVIFAIKATTLCSVSSVYRWFIYAGGENGELKVLRGWSVETFSPNQLEAREEHRCSELLSAGISLKAVHRELLIIRRIFSETHDLYPASTTAANKDFPTI